jgi:GT2 family glycosyltransferase
VRRSAVLARPFDEDIAIAEDHLWACGIGAGERIAYCPEAAVAHSHPMSLRHWRARFYAHGLATSYARNRLGVVLPWRGPERAGAVVFRRGGAFLRLAGRLARDGELRALAHLPAYALARTVWYARGVRDGARRQRTEAAQP